MATRKKEQQIQMEKFSIFKNFILSEGNAVATI